MNKEEFNKAWHLSEARSWKEGYRDNRRKVLLNTSGSTFILTTNFGIRKDEPDKVFLSNTSDPVAVIPLRMIKGVK